MALPHTKKTGSVLSIWKTVIDVILSEPKVLIPYCILAVVDILTLYILASSPHFPVSIVLAPPIRSIWGAVYLHYPYIYDLLPKLFYFAKIVTAVLIGSVTSGMAVYMIYLFKKKEPMTIKAVFLVVIKRYASLFILTIIIFAVVQFLMKQPPILLIKYFRAGHHAKLLHLGPKFWFNVFMPVVDFVLAVILQGLFVYSFPYVVIKGKKFLAAILLGFGLFFRTIVKTLSIVVVPMLFYIPVTMLRDNMAFLVDKYGPEIVVTVLLLGILVGTVIVDSLVTIATTLFFIEAIDEK